jgi:hypothetical protein
VTEVWRLTSTRRLRLVGLLGLIALASPAAAEEPRITVPPGFRAGVFARNLGLPRFMAVDPAGTLLNSRALSSSASEPKGSLVPLTKSVGTRRAPRWAMRRSRGRPGGCSG